MGVVNTTDTFQATDTITSSKLNNIIDQTTFTGDAIQGTTLQVVSPGKLAVNAGGITSNELASGAVTTNAIADGAVTPAKLSPFGPAWSNGLDNFNIQQNSLELATGITSNTTCFIDFHSVQPLTDYETRIARDSGVDGWFAIQNQGAGRITFSSAGGFQFANAHMPNPVGNAPIFGVRAWVNFNGISGSVAIRQDGNVDSVSRTGTGQYTINLTIPMDDTNYAIVGFARDAGTTPGNYFVSAVSNGTKTTSSFQIRVHSTGGLVDSPEINIMVIR
jgi:hypothetical protein